MNKKIKNIKNKLLKIIKKPNNNLILRKRILSINQLFYLYLSYVSSDISLKCLSIEARIKFDIDISKQALIKKFNNLDHNKIININKQVSNDIFYKNNNNVNYIAVDGSWLNVSKHFKYNYKLSRDKQYKKILLSCLYDVHKNIPLYYSLNKSNEREALLNDIKYIPNNSIIIGDRGYFSEHVVNTLILNKIGFIFRLLKSYNIVKNNLKKLKNNKKITIAYKKHKLNIFYYKINKEDYFIATSNLTLNIKNVIKLYKDRWNIETHFGFLKENYKFNDINFYNYGHMLSKLYMSQLNILLNEAVNNNINHNTNKQRINKKISKELFKNYILNFFFRKGKIKKIIMFFNMLVYNFQIGRTFKRIRKKPSTKWLSNRFKFYYLKR